MENGLELLEVLAISPFFEAFDFSFCLKIYAIRAGKTSLAVQTLEYVKLGGTKAREIFFPSGKTKRVSQ